MFSGRVWQIRDVRRSRAAFGAGVIAIIVGAAIMVLGALIFTGSLMDMDPPRDEPVFWPLLVGCAVTAIGATAMWFGDQRPPTRIERS